MLEAMLIKINSSRWANGVFEFYVNIYFASVLLTSKYMDAYITEVEAYILYMYILFTSKSRLWWEI